MPPDADKIRQRKTHEDLMDNDQQPQLLDQVASVKQMGRNEIAIDGVIYDITDFDHPGGDSINIFGGNDVTVTYRMIHPYHTSKHLEKMKRVGTIQNYVSE